MDVSLWEPWELISWGYYFIFENRNNNLLYSLFHITVSCIINKSPTRSKGPVSLTCVNDNQVFWAGVEKYGLENTWGVH